MIHVLDLNYDDDGSNTPVLVPSVYNVDGLEGPDPWIWIGRVFPLSRDSRDSAWEEILDSGKDPPGTLHRRLLDAWDTSKRSREYVNGDMDKHDLDNLYYAHAYRDEADDM